MPDGRVLGVFLHRRDHRGKISCVLFVLFRSLGFLGEEGRKRKRFLEKTLNVIGTEAKN